MNKIILIAILSFFSSFAFSQDVSVEKSTSGIQIGVLGTWYHKELKLKDKLVVRSEFGLDGVLWGGSFYPTTGYLFTPVLRVEPRWYFNIKKRARKSKKVAGNGANFLSIRNSFNPDWFTITNYEGVEIVETISVIPTWGIKRNLNNWLTFETGIGVGYIYHFAKRAGYLSNEGDVGVNLHLRLGYRFRK